MNRPMRLALLLSLGFLTSAGCASKFLKYKDEDKLNHNDEFESSVKITDPGAKSASTSSPVHPEKMAATGSAALPAQIPKGSKKLKFSSSKKKAKGKDPVAEVTGRREPDLEDDEGFSGRRPLMDPFRVGEKVVHHVRYFRMNAGLLTFRVDPFVEVNGRKSYSFATEIKTASVFDSFYSVEDKVLTLMDFDQLIPRAFTLHVKETGQLREARSFFDFDKLRAKYWEKKVTEKNGVEEKKQEWEILPFSQNVFSAVYYMRLFKWDIGKEYSFRVADDEKNIVFKGTALRREVLETDLGPMKSIVIKPEISVKGVFQPVGDIFIWLSDDDRKLVLRIESKIKIGTLVSEVQSISPGE